MLLLYKNVVYGYFLLPTSVRYIVIVNLHRVNHVKPYIFICKYCTWFLCEIYRFCRPTVHMLQDIIKYENDQKLSLLHS